MRRRGPSNVRTPLRGPTPRVQPVRPAFVVALVVIGVLTLLGSGRLGWLHGHARLLVGPMPRTSVELYPANDPWAAYLPAPNACAQSTSASAAPVTAEGSMICVLNYARVRAGLTPLRVSPLLNRSAAL